jgi:hypothetical protein
MADFRRVVTALAVLALLAGFAVTANAQTTGPAFSCTASAAVPPQLRAEGLTELTGDIVLNCTGGTALAAGTAVPPTNFANFTVFLGNTTVTSRILDTTTNASEALLLIDEPNTTLGGGAAFNVCTTPTTGCGGNVGATKNVFQGIVSGNSVTFIGIPVVPPGSTGTRIFRVTNVRANASAVGTAGPGGTPGQVQAFISISGPTSVPINNPTQIVGFVQTGLNFFVRKASDVTANLGSSQFTFAACKEQKNGTVAAVLQYSEGFPTAFKPRVTTDASGALQSIPGAVYNTESGLVVTGVTGTATGVAGTLTAGLADAATRLRATFNNIPTGVSVFVGTVNDLPKSDGTVDTGKPQVAGTAPFAQLVANQSGPTALVTATDTLNGIPAAQVAISGGTGVAVWEIANVATLSTDNLFFNVYFAFKPSGNPATGVTGTVSGSFAPAPPAFDAAAGAKASATLPIPRFADTGTPKTIILINICRTTLLFPFVTNQAGFDTGLAIANTTSDPFGTTAQTGACVLNFFGDNAPAAITSAAIAGGKVQTFLASTSAPNFQGYVFAVCDFQFGHGFAFVSDLGARNLAMGYLALVLPETPRQSTGLSSSGTGEILGQ